MIYGFAYRTIGMIVGGVLLLCLLLFALGQCEKRRDQAAQSRVERAQGTAAAQSGKDAVETVSKRGEAATASEELTRTNEQEIRHAQGAGERVGAGVNLAGLRALCRREAYRNSERCKLQHVVAEPVAARR